MIMVNEHKKQLNIKWKFNEKVSEEESDKTLFKVFEILLDSVEKQKELNKKIIKK